MGYGVTRILERMLKINQGSGRPSTSLKEKGDKKGTASTNCLRLSAPITPRATKMAQLCRAFADGETRTRTGDTTIFSRVLYQLSYLAARARRLAPLIPSRYLTKVR